MTSMKPSNTDSYALDLRFEGYDPTGLLLDLQLVLTPELRSKLYESF